MMEKYVGANFVLSRTGNGIFIELNDSNYPDCCEEFIFEEIKHLLKRPDNSDYAVSPQCQNCGSSEGGYSLGEVCKICHSEI